MNQHRYATQATPDPSTGDVVVVKDQSIRTSVGSMARGGGVLLGGSTGGRFLWRHCEWGRVEDWYILG